MCLHHIVVVHTELEEGIGFPEAGIIDVSHLTWVLGPELGSLEEQQVLCTTEPSLRLLDLYFLAPSGKVVFPIGIKLSVVLICFSSKNW